MKTAIIILLALWVIKLKITAWDHKMWEEDEESYWNGVDEYEDNVVELDDYRSPSKTA